MRPFQNFMIGLSRACLGAICAAAIAVLATTMPAAADDVTPVETFAQQQVDKGISILTDKSLSPPARQAAIGDFVLSLMDLKRIALYALGPAAQSAPKEDVDAFVEAFKKFTLANYESQLGAYNGETIKIVDAVQHGPSDFVVSAAVSDPTDPPGTRPLTVRFRVVDEIGKYAILDASIDGIWFEVAQHDDIQGFLAQNSGDVKKLVAHLNDMTAALSASR